MAALAVGWGVSGAPADRRSLLRQTAILVAIGIAPDLDLLIGRHSMETHSVGAAVIVATFAAWQRWPVASSRLMIWLAVALAWMSHPLLDALGSDTSVPIGIMAFWPLSDAHVQTGWEVFGPISRRYWRDDFLAINLRSVSTEILILTPILLATRWITGRRGGQGNAGLRGGTENRETSDHQEAAETRRSRRGL